MSAELRIEITENGPYAVTGAPLLRMGKMLDEAGRPVAWERGAAVPTESAYDLCRCGRSADKPFCDGSHKVSPRFDGTETADRAASASRRKEYMGEGLVLTDDKSLCEHASFCVRGDTHAWKMVRHASDPGGRAALESVVASCPSGRLELHAATDPTLIEPELAPEIALVVDGPLWIRGGIPIRSSDGFSYEVRNRVTLCRCGASKNKPFCDGSHAEVGFREG